MIKTHQKRITSIQIVWAAVAILLIIGIIFVYSASSVLALTYYGSAHYFLKKHLIGIALGLITALCIQWIPIRLLQQGAPYFFWGALLLTAATLFPHISHFIHGSRRWLAIGSF